ncbi:hypothetical protein KS083_26510, partial [Klebsiella pneumoniae subsp. ozaenae]|nr:hypothetical protein [Klebsiella pneumoniae subsp. ozaenae]
IVIHPEECLARFDGPDEAFRVRCHTKLPYTLGRSTVAHWISFFNSWPHVLEESPREKIFIGNG